VLPYFKVELFDASRYEITWLKKSKNPKVIGIHLIEVLIMSKVSEPSHYYTGIVVAHSSGYQGSIASRLNSRANTLRGKTNE